MRRIFQLYRDGFSLAAIAKQLNADKVPPPRGDHPLRRDRGWVPTTVRSMLYNATYSGVVSYNDREWRKLPGTNERRYRRREAKELIQVVDPKLRSSTKSSGTPCRNGWRRRAPTTRKTGTAATRAARSLGERHSTCSVSS